MHFFMLESAPVVSTDQWIMLGIAVLVLAIWLIVLRLKKQ